MRRLSLFKKILHRPSGEADYRAKGPRFQVALMKRNRDDSIPICIDTVLLPFRNPPKAIPFQDANDLRRFHGGQSGAHPLISIFSTVTSAGIGLPNSLAASRKPAIASRAIAFAWARVSP